MTPAEEGAYIRLLCHLWNQKTCSLTLNDKELSVLSRLGENWEKSKSKILSCFNIKNGKVFNKKLLDERKKQNEFRKKQAHNGSKGGRPKKGLGLSGLTQTKAKKSSHSSSLTTLSMQSMQHEEKPKPFMQHDRQKIFEYLRFAADTKIPDEIINHETDEIMKKYEGEKITSLRSLCNEWAANMKFSTNGNLTEEIPFHLKKLKPE